MLIGIGGPTLSGKTTMTLKLCEELAERGFRVGLVPEFAKTVAKEMGISKVEDVRRNPEKYFQFELEVLLKKLTLEERLRERFDFVVSDTTLAEIILYSKLYLPNNFSRIVESIAKKYLKRYDVVFLLEPLNVQSNDGFRSERDVANRRKHYAILKRIYPKFVEIPVASVDERLEWILDELLQNDRTTPSNPVHFDSSP